MTGILTETQWRVYCKSGKRPDDIPASPPNTYKGKGWISWGDFLGTGKIADQNKVYRKFTKARSFAHALKLNSKASWDMYCKSGKKPADIPALPQQTYKGNGWYAWGDFLGTGRVADQNKVYRKFTEARSFAHSLNLKSKAYWDKYCKSGEKPNDIPSSPSNTYKGNGWNGWGDFLGTGR